MERNFSRLWRISCLLILVSMSSSVWGQWHQYCFRDTFQITAGTSAVFDVLANDDLNPAPTDINYLANPITADYPYPFGALVSENGGTLVILNNDSIQYTPPSGFTGSDRFYYGVADVASPTGVTDTAQVLVEVGSATGIAEEMEQQLVLFPNPAKDVLRLDGLTEAAQIEVVSLEGKVVAVGNQEVAIADLAPGMYVARVQIGDAMLNRRFLKQ